MTEQAMEPGTSTTARSVLKIDGLVAGYGGGDVLRGVSLEVSEGGITCVVGPNGAGKSTLMATISGLLRRRPSLGRARQPGGSARSSGLPMANGNQPASKPVCPRERG